MGCYGSSPNNALLPPFTTFISFVAQLEQDSGKAEKVALEFSQWIETDIISVSSSLVVLFNRKLLWVQSHETPISGIRHKIKLLVGKTRTSPISRSWWPKWLAKCMMGCLDSKMYLKNELVRFLAVSRQVKAPSGLKLASHDWAKKKEKKRKKCRPSQKINISRYFSVSETWQFFFFVTKTKVSVSCTGIIA